MFDEVRSALATLEGVVRDFEPRTVEGCDAMMLVELFSRVEHLGAAGKALAARRVDDTGAHRESGHRSAGDLLAQLSGVMVGAAESTLRAVQRLDDLPETSEAFRAGELSEVQAREISYAAEKDPESETRLVGMARRRRPIKGLKQECARVVAATIEDDQAWAIELHDSRSMHMWDDHGHLRAEVRLAPDRAIGFHAAVEAETDRLFREARTAGRREPRADPGHDGQAGAARRPRHAPRARRHRHDQPRLLRHQDRARQAPPLARSHLPRVWPPRV